MLVSAHCEGGPLPFHLLSYRSFSWPCSWCPPWCWGVLQAYNLLISPLWVTAEKPTDRYCSLFSTLLRQFALSSWATSSPRATSTIPMHRASTKLASGSLFLPKPSTSLQIVGESVTGFISLLSASWKPLTYYMKPSAWKTPSRVFPPACYTVLCRWINLATAPWVSKLLLIAQHFWHCYSV